MSRGLGDVYKRQLLWFTGCYSCSSPAGSGAQARNERGLFLGSSISAPIVTISCCLCYIISAFKFFTLYLLLYFHYICSFYLLLSSLYFLLAHGLADHGPQVKSSPLPVFVNKFYWNTAMLIHVHIVYGCFHDTTAELSCNHMAPKSKIFIFLYRKSLRTPVLAHLSLLQSPIMINNSLY